MRRDRLTPQFSIRSLVVLKKADGSRHPVEIEGYSVSIRSGVIYSVREVLTRIGYPAAPADLHADDEFVRSEIDRVMAERRAARNCDLAVC